MKRFIVTYLAPPKAAMEAMMNATPEQKAEGMKPWTAWMEKCGSALIDGGAPLMATGHLTPSGWEEPQSNVTGYSILEAENLEAAKALVDNHPHLAWIEGCAIDIFEAMSMEM
jgi:hypothetical protein